MSAVLRFATLRVAPAKGPSMKTRDQAIEIFKRHNQSDSLYRHALAVEGVMRHFAARYGEDADYWGMVGLLHDVDYGSYPDEHCRKAVDLLKAEGFDDSFIRSVVSHGYGIVSDVKPEHVMEKVLFATDELTGLITAAALMRPSKSVMDFEVSSLRKKWKDKKFAAGVDRGIVTRGCEDLGLPLDEVMTETIAGMRAVAADIGLG